MKIYKLILVLAVGFGIAWAENEPAARGENPGGEETGVEQLSQAELDAEIERVEAALGDQDEVKEFIPTKPLAADLPVALPSDI
jgi:hypothetical protein